MNQSNHKPTGEEKQSQLQRWIEELGEKLPPCLEESAKEYGAIIRKRGIKSAMGLMVAMFMYVLSDLSQRLLAAYAEGMGIASVSDQAWQKKFAKRAMAKVCA